MTQASRYDSNLSTIDELERQKRISSDRKARPPLAIKSGSQFVTRGLASVHMTNEFGDTYPIGRRVAVNARVAPINTRTPASSNAPSKLFVAATT